MPRSFFKIIKGERGGYIPFYIVGDVGKDSKSVASFHQLSDFGFPGWLIGMMLSYLSFWSFGAVICIGSFFLGSLGFGTKNFFWLIILNPILDMLWLSCAVSHHGLSYFFVLLLPVVLILHFDRALMYGIRVVYSLGGTSLHWFDKYIFFSLYFISIRALRLHYLTLHFNC